VTATEPEDAAEPKESCHKSLSKQVPVGGWRPGVKSAA